MADRITLTAQQLADFLAGKSFTAGAGVSSGAVSGLTPYHLLGQSRPQTGKVSKESVNYRSADPEHFKRRCGTCVMYRSGGSCTLVEGKIVPTAVCDRWAPRQAAKGAQDEPYVAGLMVRAADTGRVLMLQRAITGDDPASGRWEPPGGHAEPGETLLQAALREFSEETGMRLPKGQVTGFWDASNGIYRGYVMTVPAEADVPIFDGRDQVWDPDDPKGDHTQAIAWFDPDQFAGNPSMRDEMADDLPQVMAALAGDAEKSSRGGDAETLREYWARQAHGGPTHFEFADQIKWGTPGDYMRAVRLLMEHAHMTEEQAKGYANLLHHRALGYWPAQHARMAREGMG